MSRTFDAPRWGIRAMAVGALALMLSALAALALTSRADAAFTTGKCAGADIIGRGASFARDAHNVFINNFQPIYCAGTPALASVTYEALGSGAGKNAAKAREVGGPRFGMSDEPPPPSEIEEMNKGLDLDPSNDGQVHVIPAAVGAVAPLVNFPDGCDVTQLDAESKTAEVIAGTAPNEYPLGLVRVRFNKTEWENVWAKNPDFDEWHEVFPELDGDAACEKPITRVVRFDTSGTTYAFKDYLNSVNGGRGWLTTYIANKENRQWPESVVGPRADCANKEGPGSQDDAIDHLTSGCANGNGELVKKLVVTDGSVGYSDISTARGNSPSLSVTPRANKDAAYDNDVYWTQLQNGSDTFTEPTSSPNGFRSDGPKGSNCLVTEFENIPSATLGQDWSPVSGVESQVGFGICTLTYGLVFDDSADVWGNSPVEEAKARTVKDYWENILSPGAQAALFPNDYAPLSASILNIAKAGVASIDWNKGEGGGGGNEETPPPVKTAPIVTTPPPAPVPPSNRFSLLKKAISSKSGQATISVKLPGAGKLVMVGTAKNGKKSIKVGQVVLNANKAGTFKLTLKPSGAAKKVLKKKGSLKVKLKLTYTPNGGSAKASQSALTLKLKKNK